MDHSCLNCKSMEQTGCECPCECSLYSSSCTQQSVDNLESCPPIYEQGSNLQTPWIEPMNLKSCPSINCKSYTTEIDCLGVANCQWCHVDTDGETPLQQPYCSDMSTCFKGILGSLIPYSDGTYSKLVFFSRFCSFDRWLTKLCLSRFAIDRRDRRARVAVGWTGSRWDSRAVPDSGRHSVLLQAPIGALESGAPVFAPAHLA